MHRRLQGPAMWAALWAVAWAVSGSGAASAHDSPEAGQVPQRRWARLERMAMGTRVVLAALVHEPTFAYAAFEAALEEVHRLEVLMTSHRHPGWPASDVQRLEAAAGDLCWVPVAPETCAVLALAQDLRQHSDGAFDISAAPLGALWPTGSQDLPPAALPSPAARAAARARIGGEALQLDCAARRARLLRRDMSLDLGGIAKGAIVDAAAARLQAAGLADFAVEAGGDMRVRGAGRSGPWTVALRSASAALSAAAPLQVALLAHQALSTSGDEARAWQLGDHRLHHLLDPVAGDVARGARTVSVVAPQAALSDALATSLFVLPLDQGRRLLARYPGCEALRVDADGEAWATAGFPLLPAADAAMGAQPPPDGPQAGSQARQVRPRPWPQISQ